MVHIDESPWEVSRFIGHPCQSKIAVIILCMRPANEGRRYNVTSSLIGWAHTLNDPWNMCETKAFIGTFRATFRNNQHVINVL